MLNNSNMFSMDAIENELAHQGTNPIRGTYRRGNAMDERVKTAQWSADHLDMLRSG